MSLDTAGIELSPLILTPLQLSPLGLTADASFEDLVDSPNWDTYPVSGQSTNWSLIKGVYTLKGSTTPNQAIVYRKMDLLDVAINATVLNAFTQNTQADNFLSCRISDADTYIGCRYNQNGFIVSDVVAGVPTNLATLVVTTPFSVRIVAQGDKLRVYYNGSLAADLTTSIVVAGQVGIIARANTSAVPLSVFRNYRPIAVYPIISNVVTDVTLNSVNVSCETDVPCAAELFIGGLTRGVTALGTAHSWPNIELAEWTEYDYRIAAQSEYGTDAQDVTGQLQTEGEIPVIQSVQVIYGAPPTNVTIQCGTSQPCNATLRVENISQGTTATGETHQWVTSGWSYDTTYAFTIDAINPDTNQHAAQYQGTFTPVQFIPAVFSLNLTNPQGSESRAPGNCYAWNGSQFRRFTDPNSPITIGVPDNGVIDSPSLQIEGETIYPLYPEWIEGETVDVGDQRWLNKQNGDNVIVTMTQAITLPEMGAANPSTYTEGPNYIPNLGMYCEEDTIQLMDNPDTGTFEYYEPTVTPTGTYTTNIIEGASDVEWIQCAGSNPVMRELATATVSVGDIFMASWVIELHPSDVANVNAIELITRLAPSSATNPNQTIQIHADGTTEVIAGNPEYTVRWLKPNVFICWLKLPAAVGNSNEIRTYVKAFPISDGQDCRIATHCKNMYKGTLDVQPIPYQATRPGNTELLLGTSQEAWEDTGLNDEATVLIITDDTGFSNGTMRGGLLTLRAGTAGPIVYLQDNNETLTNLRVTSYVTGGVEVATSHTSGIKRPYTARLMHSLSNQAMSMNSAHAGRVVRKNGDNEYVKRAISGNLRLNVNGAIVGALRHVIFWADPDIISDASFEDLFGPGNFEGN